MPKKINKSKSKKNTKQSLHWFKKSLFVFLLIFCFAFLSYIGYLDFTVRKTFAGKPWSIPAKVFASPLEIYSGYQVKIDKFEDLLLQLNYRQDYQLSSEGTYYKKGQQISIKTRRFLFWDKEQKSQLLRVKFSNTAITHLLSLSSSKDIPIFRMDPIQIGSFYPTRKEDRILITLEHAPDSLIHGLLATEDHDFYNHIGISFKAIARAVWVNLRAGSVVQGGSTITQQLIKNFYLSPEKSLWRKSKEALMAMILEFNYEKDEILEAYLNEIYLGQDGASSVHGFGLASHFYFGRPLKNLPLQDVSALVALVRGPSYYDLRKHPNRAIKRRNLVLDEMHKQGFITKRQALAAKNKKINVIARTRQSANRYPSFLDLVRRRLSQEYREEDLTSEGLRIFTTLDTRVQNALEKTIEQKLIQLEKRPQTANLETAAIVTRREGGEIVALAGGRDARGVGFNRALDAIRPIGSLIKPVVYLTALAYSNKYSITTKVKDTTVRIKDKKGKIWKPNNYDKKEHGEVAFHTALAKSYNLATVRIGMDVGVARIAKTLKNLGVDRPVNLFPSLLLGASPLTPLEVTQLYQTLADDGFSTPLRSIRAVIAADGERLQSYPYTVRQAVDPAATYITNTILQEAMSKGTGRSAYRNISKEFGLVGKTGTTNGLRDSWFAGYSGDYLSVAWVGRDDNKPSGLTGAAGALQIWTKLMEQISTQPVSLIPPDNIEMHWVDSTNGFLANEECNGSFLYPYIRGSAPEQSSPCLETTINRTKTWFNDFFSR
ncbi:MAG: penicillin-binding protein 1B [Methylococcales bacterium]|nr:penicillin-binding protein 1B [Methylococcales bacterium]